MGYQQVFFEFVKLYESDSKARGHKQIFVLL